jgi:sulfate transport system substrate-binding protein
MFALAKEGDVHLTWENEALREVAESKGELEIVYPAVSILPNIRLFPITVVAKDWADAQEKFFGEDGIYATVQSAPTK